MQPKGTSPDPFHRLAGERARHFHDYDAELAHRDDAVTRLFASAGPGAVVWQNLLDKRDHARSELDAISGQLGRPVGRMGWSKRAFIFVAIAFAIVEAPVNKFLFDVALQGSNLTSYLVSFAIAIFVLVAAHMAGKLTRQIWSEYRTRLHISNIVITALIAILLAVVVGVLTVARAEFSAAAAAASVDLFSNMTAKVASEGFFGVLASALGDVPALVLATVNVTGILATFLLGYFLHDPDKHFDKASEAHDGAIRALNRLDAKFKRGLNKTKQQSRERLDHINKKYNAANAAIVAEKTARGIPLGDDDRVTLSSLDRMLATERVKEVIQFEGDEGVPSSPATDREPLTALISAASNIARVPARETK